MKVLPRTDPAPEGPHRSFGFAHSLAMVLGSIVGLGVFLTPGEVATAASGTWSYLGIWLAGGIMAAAGAQVYAFLGSRYPSAGGDYVFLDRAFGRPLAWAWGMVAVLVSFPGSMAALAVGATSTLQATSFGAGLGAPLLPALGTSPTLGDLLALALVWTLSAWNLRGGRDAGRLQVLLTWTPMTVFLALSLWVLVRGPAGASVAPVPPAEASAATGSLASALCAVFFAFSGWNVLTYIGGEVAQPRKNIPIATLVAVVATTAIYLAMNAAFVEVVSLPGLRAAPNAGVAIAVRLFGNTGADALAVLMLLSLMAGLNATAMAGSRIVFAMARDGFLTRWAGHAVGTRRTLGTALFLQATLASVLVVTGSFELLATLTGAVMILMSCLTVASVFRLARTRDDLAPGWTHLASAVLFLASGGLVLVMAVLDAGPWPMVVGTVAIAGLAACHRVWNRAARRPDPLEKSLKRCSPCN